MKHTCEYCGGHTHDDKRGNCVACGAPRTKPPDVANRQADQMMAQAFPFENWMSQINPWNINGGGE